MPFNFVSSEACSTVDMSSKNNLLVSKNKKKATNSELKILAKSVNLPRSWSFLRFPPQKMIIQEDLGRKIFVFLICHTLGESNSADGSHQVGWLKSEFAIQAGAHRVHMSVRKLTGTHRKYFDKNVWNTCLIVTL